MVGKPPGPGDLRIICNFEPSFLLLYLSSCRHVCVFLKKPNRRRFGLFYSLFNMSLAYLWYDFIYIRSFELSSSIVSHAKRKLGKTNPNIIYHKRIQASPP